MRIQTATYTEEDFEIELNGRQYIACCQFDGKIATYDGNWYEQPSEEIIRQDVTVSNIRVDTGDHFEPLTDQLIFLDIKAKFESEFREKAMAYADWD